MDASKYEHIRLTDHFINLTNEVIHVYESTTGIIKNFVPESREIPQTPEVFLEGAPIVHYIVNQEIASNLEALGRSLDDIAIVDRKLHGRNNVEITYLVWAKDPTIPVNLYNRAHSISLPHL